MYIILVLASLGHRFVYHQFIHTYSIAYFELIKSTGAVATGVIQALRAVLVFGISHSLFCSVETKQCYTSAKGISTCVVMSGIILFAYAKRFAIPVISQFNEIPTSLQDNAPLISPITGKEMFKEV